jgi:hypothetical protein
MPDTRSSREPRDPRSRWLYLAGSVAVLALAYRPLLAPGQLLAMGDFPFFHLPLRTLFRTALGEGIPWWNGAVHGGQPILSNPNYASFYPPSWIALIAPVPLALQLILVLHAVWAFGGAWKLARRLGCRRRSALLAATAFALGGSLLSSTSILTLFCGLSWIPWILLWGHRVLEETAWLRPACLLASGLAAQLLAGEPVACIVSGIALFGLAVDGLTTGRKTGLRLGAAVVLALALGAVQLLPTMARLADSPRGSGELESKAGLRSMHPVRFAELVVAHPLGDPHLLDDGLFFGQRHNDMGFPYIPSIYPGLLVTILAVAGLARPGVPLRAAWITMLLVGAALAVGRHNPLYLEGLARLPVLDQVRYPEKYVLAALAALPFAAALHWDRLLRRPDGSEGRLGVLLAAGATVLLALLGGLFLVLPEAPVWLVSSTRDTQLTTAAAERITFWTRTETLAALGVAAMIWLLLTRGRHLRAGWLAALAVGLLATDLAWQNRHALQMVQASTILQPEESPLGPPGDGRIFTDLMFAPGAIVPLRDTRNGPDAYWSGLETAHPYVATLWGHSYALNLDWDLMLTRPGQRALFALSRDWGSPKLARHLLGAWNVETLLLHRPLGDVLRDRFEGRPGSRLQIEANPELLPFARVVPRVTFHPDPEVALEAARAAGYSVGEHGHWVGPSGTESRSAESARLELVSRSWSQLEMRAYGDQPTLVQVAVTFDPGWRASASGRPVAVYETATGQMGLVLPAGGQPVVLRFTDRAVPIGFGLTLIALLSMAVLWTVGHRKQLHAAAASRHG